MEVKMGDLGNKSNPWLAGLTGLGEGLLQGYLYKQKMNQQQDEFNQKMAAEERQNSLLNDIAMKKYQSELQNQTMDNQRQDVNTIINLNANYDVKKASDYPDGKYPTGAITGSSLLGSLSNKGLVSPDAVYVPKTSTQKAPEYTTTEIPDAKTGTEKTYSHIKGTEFGSPSWKQIGEKPIYKPTSPTSDLSNPNLVGDIEGTFATLKGMAGDANDPAKAPLKANLISKTEALMDSAGLTGDVGHIWDAVQKGADVERAINVAQLARKKSFTPKQKDYLRLYFKTRFIPQENK